MSIAPAPAGLPRPSFWRSVPVLSGLGEAGLALLAARARRRVWGAGEVIFQRGDPGDWLLVIAEGRVRLAIGTAGGRELVLRHAEAGDCLGELALFDGAPRSADATALGPVAGWTLARADWEDLCAADPALAQAALRWTCTRLRETTEQMESIALYGLAARAARFLLFTLRQLNGADLPPRATLRLDLSQSEIAGILGATRPKVNRALLSLEEDGAIRRSEGVLDCDVARLTALADPEGEGAV